MECVCRWFWANSHTREVLLQDISGGSALSLNERVCLVAATTKGQLLDSWRSGETRWGSPSLKAGSTLWKWFCQLSTGPSPSPRASPQSLDLPALACGSHGSCTPMKEFHWDLRVRVLHVIKGTLPFQVEGVAACRCLSAPQWCRHKGWQSAFYSDQTCFWKRIYCCVTLWNYKQCSFHMSKKCTRSSNTWIQLFVQKDCPSKTWHMGWVSQLTGIKPDLHMRRLFFN